MYAGRIVERLTAAAIRAGDVAHPYSRALLQSTPTLRGGRAELRSIPGRPPAPVIDDDSCPFVPRCSWAHDRCREVSPVLRTAPAGIGHQVACHLDPEVVVRHG
jgi:oligopeptide/dipeptide ABC transporter ATP-binding protein